MKKCWIFVVLALLLALMIPVQAAENTQVLKGQQVAADAGKMEFPTDGGEYQGICPVCQTMATWIPLGQENFNTAGYRLENGKHYYLTESIEGVNARILSPEASNTVGCIHLNGKNVTSTHATSTAISGSGGVLNIMGSGIVKGSVTNSTYGSAVQINTSGSKGAVNLWGGTYGKVNTSDNTNVIGVRTNGGIINLYAAARVEGGTNGSAIYLNTTSKVKGTVNLYGATVDNRNSSKVAVKISATDAKAVEVNQYGGEILGSAAGAVSVAKGSAFRMYSGTIKGNGTADAVAIAAGGAMYLNDFAIVEQGAINISGTLHLGAGWAGSAAVRFATEYAVGATIPTSLLVADGSFTGQLSQNGMAGLQPKDDGSLYVAGTQLIKADGTVTETADPLAEWATGAYAYMKLNGNLNLADLKGLEMTIDLNGFDLTAGGNGSVKLLDSGNDTFDADNCGQFVNQGDIIVAAEATAQDGRCYIAITEGNVTTAHRFAMRLTAVTLRPSAAGLYYKAQYDCDQALAQQVTAYGVAMSLQDMPGADFKTEKGNAYTEAAAAFRGGAEVTSGSVFGIMKETLAAAENAARGEMKIYANPYVTLGDKILVGSGSAYSLRDVMETIEKNYYTYSLEDRAGADAFYIQWNAKGMDWALVNVGEKFTVSNENLTFTAENVAWCDVCKKEVTWIPVTQATHGETAIGTDTKGKHYYLKENIIYTGGAKFIQAPSSGSACLHLNGHDLTATNYRVIMGYSGTLNVLGNGNVAGYITAENKGAAVHINTGGKNGTVNLYGGTYKEYTATDAAAVAIDNNGGKINIYEGATVSGTAYVGASNLVDSVLGVHGGKITSTVTFGANGGKGFATRLVTSAQTELKKVVTHGTTQVSLSGAPKISLLDIDIGTIVTVDGMVNGSDVTVRGIGAFANVGRKVADYVPYFKAYFAADSVVAEDGMLVYEADYTEYLSPWETDVVAQAKADGKIHYYFMASEKLWLRKSHNNIKWGDSCLVVFPDGQTMLIDSGYQDMGLLIAQNLQRMGVTKLDHLLISHPHTDHYGGAFGITVGGDRFVETGFMEQIDVGQLYINGLNFENDNGHELIMYTCEKYDIPVTVLKPEDTLTIGGVKLEVLWPVMEAVTSDMTDLTKDVNDTSLVIRMDYGEHSSLFTGDLYVRGEGWLLDAIDDVAKLDVDFLKVPHHGRNTSSSEAFVNAVTPELAVFTGRAAQGQVDAVYAAANAVLLNDEDHGYIHVSAEADGAMAYQTN